MFLTRLNSFDDEIFPRRGLFLAPDGFRFVWHVTMGAHRLFACDFDNEVVRARPMYWVHFSLARGKWHFTRGVSHNPETVTSRHRLRRAAG